MIGIDAEYIAFTGLAEVPLDRSGVCAD